MLSWPGSGAKRDLDLFVDFNVNDKFLCSVGFYLPQCQGVQLNYEGGNSSRDEASETATLKTIGNYKYLVYVGRFLSKEKLHPPGIEGTQARLDVYVKSFPLGPLLSLDIPFESSAKEPHRYWAALCVDASLSFGKVAVLNQISAGKPSVELCYDEAIYS